MADAVTLLLPGPRWAYVAAFALGCTLMQVGLRYARYVAVLKWLTLSLFAYLAVLAVAHVAWRDLAAGVLLPRLDASRDDDHAGRAVRHHHHPVPVFLAGGGRGRGPRRPSPASRSASRAGQGGPALRRIEIDTLVGMGFSNLVALAIMATTAAVLHANGVTDIRTSAEAAEALRPLAGSFAAGLFALGIVGTGLLAVPVLAGSAAYAIGEARRWPVGFGRRVREARAFYATVALATGSAWRSAWVPSTRSGRSIGAPWSTAWSRCRSWR